MNAGDGVLAAQVAVLLCGFGYAAVEDLRTREVSDRLWQLLGVAGVLFGGWWVAPSGPLSLGIWLLVGVLVLEHMFPWDESLGPTIERYADALELVFYILVVAVVTGAALQWGVGGSGVPVVSIAVLVVVVFARILFEFGILYGAADAKALMVAGVLLPFFASPLIPLSTPLENSLKILPFAFNVLMNAALVAVVVPLAIALRNLGRREFHGLRGFTGYTIPVRELPDRFVWVRDPTFAPKDAPEPETSEEDRVQRTAIAKELEARGVTRVWVTPQLPFVVLIALGAGLALLAGNLLLDLVFAL
ncbi:MAG TPA: hypothetical protein VEH57_09525 [Thermoplasmata archaeon]|nr:hypothetical protein [Thermoplasmata archaeon]